MSGSTTSVSYLIQTTKKACCNGRLVNLVNSAEPEKLIDVPNQVAQISRSDSIPLDMIHDITRLSKPLQSRFRRLHLPPYTEDYDDIVL
ncbi:MAG: hypothetical protein WA667_05600 [Candidatus Nitrosopolaris sp.]